MPPYSNMSIYLWITYDKARHMSEQPSAPFQTGCCSIGTQKHGPLNHSDMIVLQVLCKGDILQDDMARGKDENMWVFSPEWGHLE